MPPRIDRSRRISYGHARRRLPALCRALSAAGAAWLFLARGPAVPPSGRYLSGVTRWAGQTQPYALYVPPGYSADRTWPVILYLHGYGERGADGLAPLRAGLAPALRRHAERFPCLVLMPQTQSTRWSGRANELAFQALETVVRRYRGDRHRLYLTGVSMGGAGCWRLAAAHPDCFAAVLPICGQGRPGEVAPALRATPIWAFQGALDWIVRPWRSRAMVDAVRAAGNKCVRYTLYPLAGHNAWDKTFDDPGVIRWLLAQRRR